MKQNRNKYKIHLGTKKNLKMRSSIISLLIFLFGLNTNSYSYNTRAKLNLKDDNYFSILTGTGSKNHLDSQQVINGVVTDKNGAPLPGVNITIKGTTDGAYV